MATYFVKPTGSDAADGLSFATAWQTWTNGATTARIAAGDLIKFMDSGAPTSLGINGTWTSLPQQILQTIVSSTNATPIVITRSGHGLVTGDTVVVSGHTTNTNANGTWEVTVINSSTFSLDTSVGNGVGGASGTFRKINGMIVRLASALTQNIASCGNMRTAWTASANVTATLLTTDYKEGYSSDSIAVAAGFTTGMAAYKATGSALDLSGYQQISFWVKQTSGTLATASQLTFRLCSDAAGVTAVDTLNFPAIGALNTWQRVTINKGSALGASIQSIALNLNSDLAAQTFLFSNIIACKATSSADSLTHKSLISKNDGREYPIMSINGTRVMLGGNQTVLPTSTILGGYYGVSETVTTYKRETFDMGPFATSTTIANTVNNSGTAGNLITFSGGWNSTDMSTQTGETWFASSNGFGVGVNMNRSFIDVEKICFDNFATGVSITATATNSVYDSIKVTACSVGIAPSNTLSVRSTWSNLTMIMCGNAFNTAGCHSTFDNLLIIGGGNASNGSAQLSCRNSLITGLEINHPGDIGVICGASTASGCYDNIIRYLTVNAPATSACMNMTMVWRTLFEDVQLIAGTAASSSGITINGFCADTRIRTLSTSGHTNGITINGSAAELVLLSASIAEATEFNIATVNGNVTVFSQDHEGSGETIIRSDAFTGGSTSAIVDGGSGKAWVISPTGTSRDAFYPCTQFLGRILCDAGTLVTVTARMRRSNVALTLSLCCKGGQIAGVSNDVRSSASGAAGSFETVTITFTPTEAGFVNIIAEGYGGTTHTGYIDNLTASQA